MKIKRVGPWRGGLALFLSGLLLLILSQSFQSEAIPPQGPADEEVVKLLQLEGIPNKLLNYLIHHLTDNPNEIIPNPEEGVYDYAAAIQSRDAKGNLKNIVEVEWSSQKSGFLPGPEANEIRALVYQPESIQNFLVKQEEKWIDGNQYFRTQLHYSIRDKTEKPMRRGYIEIFQDQGQQQKKISSSMIEGETTLLPSDMLQKNLQMTSDPSGYLYIRYDQSVPTQIPEIQQHLCRSPNGHWVSRESPEWESFCTHLFDQSQWHGFSFTTIPMSYEPFLKNPPAPLSRKSANQ